MASIAISASLQITCSSHHLLIQKQKWVSRSQCSVATKQTTHVITTLNVEEKTTTTSSKNQVKPQFQNADSNGVEGETLSVQEEKMNSTPSTSSSSMTVGFKDERWKKGTWDLNCFAKDGKMDWDGVIIAEARRRKFLELYPEAATNTEPVVFRSSIIPWWAWIMRSHLPEAELLNGRAAMVGFFMAYFVDVLTGLDMVGQTGNFICKSGLLLTVIGIIVFRKKQDFGNLQKLVDEATFYDKQWQASWENHNESKKSSK